MARLTLAGLILLSLIGACQEAPDTLPGAALREDPTGSGCGDNGHLATELYGSIARKIRWSTAELQCESMLRPEGQGVRLRFSGNAGDDRLSIILALPELERGTALAESPTVVTLTVEGSGRFFSTPTLASCWSDIASQEPIRESGERYEINGTLYCITPLGEINGDAAISIPEMAFRGIVDWSTE